MTENQSHKLKRILYRSWHRGCKETDILLGDFAKEIGTELSQHDLDQFEALLSEQDWDIYNWINGNIPAPSPYCDGLIERIRLFQMQKFETHSV